MSQNYCLNGSIVHLFDNDTVVFLKYSNLNFFVLLDIVGFSCLPSPYGSLVWTLDVSPQVNIVHPPFAMSSSGKNSVCRICGGALMGNQRRWLFGGQNKKNSRPQTPTETTRGHNLSRSLQSSPWGESKTFPLQPQTLQASNGSFDRTQEVRCPWGRRDLCPSPSCPSAPRPRAWTCSPC